MGLIWGIFSPCCKLSGSICSDFANSRSALLKWAPLKIKNTLNIKTALLCKKFHQNNFGKTFLLFSKEREKSRSMKNITKQRLVTQEWSKIFFFFKKYCKYFNERFSLFWYIYLFWTKSKYTNFKIKRLWKCWMSMKIPTTELGKVTFLYAEAKL